MTPLKLRTELHAQFLRWVEHGGHIFHEPCDSIERAMGVIFLCPACFIKNGGEVGTHMVICWSRSRGVPESARPGPGRWAMRGTSLDDLTLDADPPATARSVLIDCWHGYVTNGEATLA